MLSDNSILFKIRFISVSPLSHFSFTNIMILLYLLYFAKKEYEIEKLCLCVCVQNGPGGQVVYAAQQEHGDSSNHGEHMCEWQ